MGTMCIYMLVENTQLDFLHIDYFFRAPYILHALSCLMMILLQLQHKKRPVPPVRGATRRTTMGSARFQKRRAERKDSINSRGDWNEGGEPPPAPIEWLPRHCSGRTAVGLLFKQMRRSFPCHACTMRLHCANIQWLDAPGCPPRESLKAPPRPQGQNLFGKQHWLLRLCALRALLRIVTTPYMLHVHHATARMHIFYSSNKNDLYF